MNTVTITLPLPPRALHPNSRPHFMAKANAAKKYRATASVLASACWRGPGPKWPAAQVHIVYFFKDTRRRDRDNLLAWLKAGIDGIADSGIVGNDADFVYHPILLAVDKKRPRVEIEVVKQ